MKRDFEEYFPLPWQGKCRLACYDMGFCEEFIMLDMNAVEGQDGKRPPSLIDFTARGSYDHLNGRDPILEARKDALKYLVQCANLMPECINILKEADMYMTSMLAELYNDCPDKKTEMCRVCKLKTVLDDIEILLAKLEGAEK